MKKYKILMLLAFMLISMIGFSQNVTVKNMVNTKYNISAVYSDGNTIMSLYPQLDTPSSGNNIVTLLYVHPLYPDFALSHWKIYATNCSPVLDAQHTYGTVDTDNITHCHECDDGAVSDYNIINNVHYNLIGCR